MQNIYSKTEELLSGNVSAALCIVIDTQGSTPRKQGAKMIVYPDGTIYGSIGGGAIELEVAREAVRLIAEARSAKVIFQLENDLGMHCGGSMEVYIEPLNPASKLMIFGAGHIGKCLAAFALHTGFSVTLIDPREAIFAGVENDGSVHLNTDYFTAISALEFDVNTYIVVVTHAHQSDEEILAEAAKKPHAYLGMIGSKRKIAMLRARFLEEKLLTAEELDSIDMPIGIPIKAETPQEIAVSILAKLIDVRNSR